MDQRRFIVPEALREVHARWGFTPAVAANGLLFCSGIVGTSVDGEPPAEGALEGALEGARTTAARPGSEIAALQAVRDPEAQFDTAFRALDAILRAAGASIADLVEITTYHVDMARHWEAFLRAKARHVPAPFPAWTAIGVATLAVPGGLMEIRAVAAEKVAAGRAPRG